MIDPVALHLGPLSIHWYGIAYVVGIMGTWHIARRGTQRFWGTHTNLIDTGLTPIIWGILIGGRLGHVLFFDIEYFATHPLEIVMIRRGGMSFHGGMIGVIVAMLWHARRNHASFWLMADPIACGVPWALFWGRIANWINGELYGRITSCPWGQVFPLGGPMPRHPSQLYEAALEGFCLSLMMRYAMARWYGHAGRLSGLFLLNYGCMRFAVEYVREIDWAWCYLTSGQWLSLPMLVGGIWLMCTKRC